VRALCRRSLPWPPRRRTTLSWTNPFGSGQDPCFRPIQATRSCAPPSMATASAGRPPPRGSHTVVYCHNHRAAAAACKKHGRDAPWTSGSVAAGASVAAGGGGGGGRAGTGRNVRTKRGSVCSLTRCLGLQTWAGAPRTAPAATAAARAPTAPRPAPVVPLRDWRTGAALGELTLPAEVFAVPLRVDILHRCVGQGRAGRSLCSFPFFFFFLTA
jgi:hypothetical protein